MNHNFKELKALCGYPSTTKCMNGHKSPIGLVCVDKRKLVRDLSPSSSASGQKKGQPVRVGQCSGFKANGLLVGRFTVSLWPVMPFTITTWARSHPKLRVENFFLL